MTRLQAAIFDMDGVVIDSAKLHCAAWKLIFDEFLKKYSKAHKLKLHPFTEQDYLYYVDGISRYDGVKRFLESRHIAIADGSKQSRSLNTLHGIGNRKNSAFQVLIKQIAAKIFPSSIQLIKTLRQQGIKTALVSSSKNCQLIVRSTNIGSLFDIKVDGYMLEKLQLSGKPQPDIFIEAAKQLQVNPINCMLIEDSLLGVQAGHAGKLGLVVGIDRKNLGPAIFRDYGADIVISDLKDLSIEGARHWFDYKLIYVFDKHDKLNAELVSKISNKKLVLFLDYDGTLTPIVKQPNLAILKPSISKCLRQLSKHYAVAIISGRELKDLKAKVKLRKIYYAGNHGMEISGPKLKHHEGAKFIAEMQQVHKALLKQLGAIKGIFIENKKYSLSVHFRLVAESELGKIQQAINSTLARHNNLICRGGKKVFEIRSNIGWDKGKAVLWLLSSLNLESPDILPIYIGDDTTDEDAFLALKNNGLGIIVTPHRQPTKAKFSLKNPAEVQKFLEMLIQRNQYESMDIDL
ncbi:MAG: otsB [Gammaproteobacteria bacterium]|jgi:alpha,alpha-trehalase|nr:otsB [Gammaproteobacteria bacterium]